YAHDRGVLHRDLKPSNIMLGPYGETLVMDWGLAKRYAGAPAEVEADGEPSSPSPSPDDVTATGAVLGTPQYMSPEQAAGRPVGPASDLYSLGVILDAILTGGLLDEVEESAGAVFPPIRPASVVPPGRRDARVPAALGAVCLKAMAVEPEERYPS